MTDYSRQECLCDWDTNHDVGQDRRCRNWYPGHLGQRSSDVDHKVSKTDPPRGSLAEALADTAPPACRTCLFLRDADTADRAALLNALADSSVSHTRIADALTTVGFRISEASVRRHRRSCEPEGRTQQP